MPLNSSSQNSGSPPGGPPSSVAPNSAAPNSAGRGLGTGLSVAGGRSLGIAAFDPAPIFLDGLAALVHRSQGLHWVGHASGQSGALQLCERLRPDVVILDSGLDPHHHLVRLLAAGDPALVIVVLLRESHRDAHRLSAALAAGAHAVVPRTVEPRRLAEAIRRVHLDRRFVDPTLATLTAGPKRQEVAAGGRRQMPLSRREYQVLQLVAEGMENSAVADVLYLSVETVRTHIKSILRKLSARDRTHAVAIAFRKGILVVGAEDAVVPPAPQARTSDREPNVVPGRRPTVS
jgi:DNA-binding NarL/FixJ family response regulator